VEESLERLQCKYIDLYQCHVWDDGTPLEETLHALDTLVRNGKVRYVGWSNLTGYQLMKVVLLSKSMGFTAPVSIQSQYSLLCRATEWEVGEVCAREGVALLPWSGLKGGWLSGKMVRGVGAPEGSRVAVAEASGKSMQSHPSFSQFSGNEGVWELLAGVEAIAKEHGTSVPAVALRWLLQRPAVPSIVIGCRTLAQLEDNLKTITFSLTPAQMSSLDELSAIPAPYRECVLPFLLAGPLLLACSHAQRNRPSLTGSHIHFLTHGPRLKHTQLMRW